MTEKLLPFCPSCGKEYTEGAAVCPSCGKSIAPVSSIPTPSSASAPPSAWSQPPQTAVVARASRPTGVTILGILQILGSLIMLATGVGFTALFGAYGSAILVFGILSLIFAFALFTGRNWARILVLIGAVLDIISIVGIIWGVIVLYYFTRPHVVAYFKQPK